MSFSEEGLQGAPTPRSPKVFTSRTARSRSTEAPDRPDKRTGNLPRLAAAVKMLRTTRKEVPSGTLIRSRSATPSIGSA